MELGGFVNSEGGGTAENLKSGKISILSF